MTLTIARHELSSLFRSPLAWIIAAAMQAVFAWMFLLTLEEYLGVQPTLSLQDHAPGVTAYMTYRFMAPASTLFLLICPLLTMGSFADEYRMQTFPLLQSSPVSVTAIVVGKYLGVLGFMLFLCLLVLMMPLALSMVSGIDTRTLLLALTGMVCLASAATATGLFFSTLTRYSMIAAISSIATLTFLWMLGKGSFTDPLVSAAFSSVALSTHLGSFFQGVLDTREIVYFVVISLLFIVLAIIRLDNYRYAPVQT